MDRFAKVVCIITLALGVASFAAADQIAPELLVPAASIDDGLGALPPAAEWREPWLYAIPAEKIDSGLGELGDVSKLIEVWLYAMPAEKIDSGLGELAVRVD
jgi:hypothetical protein